MITQQSNTINMKTEIERLSERPCEEAIDFRKQFGTFKEAWEACPRGDWMLWLAKTLNVDDRVLTLAKGLCANTVRQLMKDKRSIRYVDGAMAYGRGEISRDELDRISTHAAAADYGAGAGAAAATADYAAAEKNQMETADICREILTKDVLEKISTFCKPQHTLSVREFIIPSPPAKQV
jgi:hypothetical protein